MLTQLTARSGVRGHDEPPERAGFLFRPSKVLVHGRVQARPQGVAGGHEMKIVRGSFVVVLALAAASASGAGEYFDPSYDVSVTEDIVYGQAINARGLEEILYLDLYRPATEGTPLASRPTVVFAHGGSFKNGHRKVAEINPYLRDMAARGWTMASINYRLRPVGTTGSKPNHELIVEAALGDSDTLRDAHHDMLAAVRFLRANAGAYGVDPDRIAVGGSSAGAVTALQAAINTEDPGTSGTADESSDVAAAVSVSGAADPDHIEPGDPPFYMIHGGMDTTVPAVLGQQACAIATAMLNGCEHHFFPSDGHTPWSDWNDYVVQTSARFLCHVMLADIADCGDRALPLTLG